MTSSPTEVLAKLEALRLAEHNIGEIGSDAWYAYAEALIAIGPALVAVARAAHLPCMTPPLGTDDEVWALVKLADLHKLCAALAALGGPDAPQEKPE